MKQRGRLFSIFSVVMPDFSQKFTVVAAAGMKVGRHRNNPADHHIEIKADAPAQKHSRKQQL